MKNHLKARILYGICILFLAFILFPSVSKAAGEEEEGYVITATTRVKGGTTTVSRVSGGGLYADGSSATVIAYSRTGYSFLGWYDAADTSYSNRLSISQDYAFTVNSDRDLVALYEKKSGSAFKFEVSGSEFKVNNGAVQFISFKQNFNSGEKMFVSFVDDTMDFRYWVNGSGNIVSSNKDYSFIFSGETKLIAYYTPKEDRPNQGVVYFRNAYSQLFSSRTYSTSETIDFPVDIPIKMGSIFKGWYLADDNGNPSDIEATDESIHAAMAEKNAIVIVPAYVASGEECTVNVLYTDGENELAPSVSKILSIGEVKSFTAPAIDGYVFHYWMQDGQITSYATSVSVRCALTGTVTLQAVYGLEPIEDQALVVITQSYSSKQVQNDTVKYILSNTMQYYVPADCVVSVSGFVFGVNGTLFGGEDAAQNLVLGGVDVRQLKSGLTTQKGVYTYNLSTTDPNIVLYIRAYVSYRDKDGALHTIYSDINSFSYNSLNGVYYTVTFNDAEGNALQTSDVLMGQMPVYEGEEPVKAEDDEYTYNFIGWDPELAPVTADAVYNPVFEPVPIPAPDMPTAIVTEVAPLENVQLYDPSTLNPVTKTVRSIDGVYSYTADSVEDKTKEYYADWNCDYRVSFDHDIAAGSFGFYGAYSGFGTDFEAAFLSPVGFAEGDSLFLLQSLGLSNVTYHDIYTNIPEFICGAFNISDANIGTTVTVELVMWEPGTDPKDAYVVAQKSYTFAGATKLDCIHNWSNWTVSKEASCLEDGEETRVCANCDEIETRAIDALGHDLIHHDAQAATCTEVGWDAYDTCSRCYYSTYVKIEAFGHTPKAAVEENRVEPTCIAAGSYDAVVYCDTCGEELSRNHQVIDALGHDLIHHDAQAATCTEVGWDAYDTCSRCYYSTYVKIEAFGHTPKAAVEENRVEPTCIAAGSYDAVVYCETCGEELSREPKTIDALGHDLIHHDAQAATCTEVGWDAYDTCSRCYYSTYVKIEAFGHTPKAAVEENRVEPTCIAAGSYDAVVYCDTCGEELSRTATVIDALGHDLIHHDAQAATCTENGWNAYDTCSRCYYSTYVKIEAFGHTPNEAVEENYVEATCEADGSYDMVVYCDTCGEVLERVTHTIPKYPSAQVDELEPRTNLPLVNIRNLNEDLHKTVDKLNAEYSFTSVTPEDATYDYYKDWNCDYRVTFADDFLENSFGLFGEYSGFGTTYSLAFLFPNNVVAGDEVYLLQAAGLENVTYRDIRSDINTFVCGVFNVSALNLGKKMTVELIMWAPDSDRDSAKTIVAIEYTFDDRSNVDCVHNWGGWYVTTAPDCITEGEETRVCEYCNASETRPVDALGHDYIHHDSQAATCTEIGWDAYDTCSRCDYTTYTEIAALGHTPKEAVEENRVEPTCIETGSYDAVVYCDTCGEELSREPKVIDALGHDFIHHDAQAATCTEIGWDAYDTCSRCEYSTYVKIEALGHMPKEAVEENRVEPTCTETGSYEAVVYCDTCGEELSREPKVIDALGHDLINHPAQAATCTEIGWDAYDTCSRCDYTTYVEIAALGHTPKDAVEENYVEPTISEDGSYDMVVYCDTCGAELERVTHTIPKYPSALVTEKEPQTGVPIIDINDPFGDTHIMVDHLGVEYEFTADVPSDETLAYYRDWNSDYRITFDGDFAKESFGLYGAYSGYGTDLSFAFLFPQDVADGETFDLLRSFGLDNVTYNDCLFNIGTFDCGAFNLSALNIGKKMTVELVIWAPDADRSEAVTVSRIEYVIDETSTLQCIHNWGMWFETTHPTCTADGEETRTCQYCNGVEARPVSALGHDLTQYDAKAVTCTEDGWDAYEACSRCDYTTQVVIPALGHLIVEHAAQAATCTEIGWDAYVTCERCDYTTYAKIDALGHDLVHHAAQPVTCLVDGWDAYDTCERCDYTTFVLIEAPGHLEAEAVKENVKGESCTEEGSYDLVVYCEVCGTELSRDYIVVPAKSHTPLPAVRENEIPATCTEAGYYDDVVYCDVCGYKLSTTKMVIPASGHVMMDPVQENLVEPTCEEFGSYDLVRYCSVCNSEISRGKISLNRLGHVQGQLININIVEPTCTENGSHDVVAYCNRCNKLLLSNHIIDSMKGHLNGEPVAENIKEATCTQASTYEAVVYCTRCGIQRSRTTIIVGSSLGHKTVYHAPKAATCTEDGWNPHNTCERCDYTSIVVYPALGHSFGSWSVTAEPTCTEAGEETRTCSRCGETETREVEALGHDLISHAAQSATCTEIGWNAYETCLRCDYTTYAEIASFGHTPKAAVEENRVEATCLEAGSYEAVVYCNTCGAELSRENQVIAALGHDLISHAAQAATCTEIGWNAYDTCSRCDYTTYVEIAALGHNWGEPTWSWTGNDADGYTSATASFVCQNNASHTDSVSTEVTGTIGTGDDAGYMVYTAEVSFNNNTYADKKKVEIASANTFTHSDNFANVDRYLYRVGNGNTVKLGSLFKVDEAGDSAPVSSDVTIKVVAVESNSSVKGTGTNLAEGSTAKCVYSANASDWTQSTLKFTGEGPVKVTIKEGNGDEYTLNLEVVNANNATTATNASSANIVLLNDVSTSGMSISNGKTLYGNGFSVIDTRTDTSGAKGWINVTNGYANNVQFLGQYFPTAVMSGTSNQYYQDTIRLSGNSGLYNCLVTGSKYAVNVTTGNSTIEDTSIIGGAVANMIIGGGERVVLKNLTTVQPGYDDSPYGMGIIVESDVPKVILDGYLHQYNWAQQSDVPSTYNSFLGSLFNDSAYSNIRYKNQNKTYVNTGILYFNENVNLNANNLLDERNSDQKVGMPYTRVSKTALGKTGLCYTVEGNSLESVSLDYSDDFSNRQAVVIPAESWNWPNEHVSERRYCYYDSDERKVKIGFEEENLDGYSVDLGALSVNKFGIPLSYTVRLSGSVCANSIVTFTEAGEYELEFEYTDPYNYNSLGNKDSSVTYRKDFMVSVSAIKAAAKNAEFTFYGYNSESKTPSQTYSSKTVITSGGKKYVMPDVTSTSNTVKSTTVDGITVYCPVVYVDFQDNYSDFNWLYPIFLAVDIKDYANGGTAQNATTIVNHSSQASRPSSVNILTEDKPSKGTGWSSGSGKAGTEGKLSSGTYKNLYGWTSGALGSDKSESELYASFSYTDNKGDTFYYVVAYYRAAHTCPSPGCFASGTMITLADGSQKPIEEISSDDQILSWDFFTGEYVSQNISILVDHGEAEYKVTNLAFSDGTSLRTIADHGLFDIDQNKFVYIFPENCKSFIGHRFVKQSVNNEYDVVELVDAYVTEEVTNAYSITAAYTSNAFASGLLTVAPPEEFYNWIPMGETMRYDTAKFEEALAKYGTYDYSVFAEYVTEKQFDEWNGKYLKIAVDSGKITFEEIVELINQYKQFMVD